MNYFILSVLALTLVCVTNPAFAGDQEIEQLRQQLEQLKLEYNSKLEALEKRLQATEQAAKKQARTQQASASPVTVSPPVAPSKSNSFNPDISLILDGRYSHYSQDPGVMN